MARKAKPASPPPAEKPTRRAKAGEAVPGRKAAVDVRAEKARSKTGPQTGAKKTAKVAAKAPRKAGAKTVSGQRRPSPEMLASMFARFAAANPEPKGELEHVNAYTLLVAVVLSAQATDAGVNKATRALFAVADTPQKMLALGEDVVRDYIKTIGLFRNKAKNVIALSQKLISDYGGDVPGDRDELIKLPGVGRKTANVVLNMAFGQKTMAVDTHVFRVAHRLGLSNGKTPEAVEEDLMRIIPNDYLYHAHHWLILHGRYTCLARKPRCGVCVIADQCESADKIQD